MRTAVLRYSDLLRKDNIMNIVFTDNKQPVHPNSDYGFQDKQVHRHSS